MKQNQTLIQKILGVKNWFFHSSLLTKCIVIIILFAVGWFTIPRLLNSKSQKIQYQSEQAQRGTLIVTVTSSGQVSTANSASVTTQTSGVVSKIYVQNGQQIQSGDPIAEVDLDMDGKQRAAQALANYQNAKNALAGAQADYYALQSTLFSNWKTYTDVAENSTYQNADGSPNSSNRTLTQFTTVQDNWLSAEAKYKNQQGVVTQTQTALNSAWATYQQASPTIYAPISGTISGLSLQVGAVLTAQTSSAGNSTAQRIANIKTQATPTATVSLSEIDVPKVKIGNKATLTLDAFQGKTFTGKVVSIDTTGVVSSGVTTYPVSIVFDTAMDGIYPNMAVDAKIITKVKDHIVLVPSSAIQTTDGQSSVRILKNNTATSVPVEVGDQNDTQTEVISGVNDGDNVVTGTTGTTTKTGQTSASPFGSIGGRGFGGGGFRPGGR